MTLTHERAHGEGVRTLRLVTSIKARGPDRDRSARLSQAEREKDRHPLPHGDEVRIPVLAAKPFNSLQRRSFSCPEIGMVCSKGPTASPAK